MRVIVMLVILIGAADARADQTITLEASQLTVTLPGGGSDWQTTKLSAAGGTFDMLTYIQANRALAFSVSPWPRGCTAWRASRTEARSDGTYWPSGLAVFKSINATNVTEKTCLQLTRGAFLLFVTHAPTIDEIDSQQILAVLDAVTYAGGGAGNEPAPAAVNTGGVERLPMPGTGLAISVPGGSSAWAVSTKHGVRSDIDYVVRKDINQPWFQISAFRFQSPASCRTWERASRRDGERYVANPAYSPRPFAFETRAKKDGHFVGTSCLPTSRGDFLVLFEYRGTNDHDEDALARAATESMLDSAGGARDAPSSGSGRGLGVGGGTTAVARPKLARVRILDAGYTQITPDDNRMLEAGSGATLGIGSIAISRTASTLAGAGEFETRWGYDSRAGVTADIRLGLGFAIRMLSSTLLLATAGAGFDAVGLGQEADPMRFKADGAFYLYLQGQLMIVAGRSFGLGGTMMFANRIGETSGGERRFGANLVFRRGRKSDIVLGVRAHDYDIGSGAKAFTASLGLGY